jgi:dTDP-4-amino-4,6-dideoxyglucose
MSEVCAAMGIANLECLPDIVACNKRNLDEYRAGFAGVPGIRLVGFDEAERCNYQYVIAEVLPGFGRSRDELVARLHDHRVLARKYFAPGCHCVEPFASALTCDPGLPHTQELCERLISFPTGTCVSLSDVRRVVSLVRDARPEAVAARTGAPWPAPQPGVPAR